MAGVAGSYIEPTAVNNHDVVIGQADFKPFIRDETGFHYINDLLTDRYWMWTENTVVTDINDRGQIVGYGQYSGGGLPVTHVILLNPIPEPCTLAMLATGASALLVAAWRRRWQGCRNCSRA